MKPPPPLLTMNQAQFAAVMDATRKIAKCSSEDALRTFLASHPDRLLLWARDMNTVADYFEQWGAAIREARKKIAPAGYVR